MNDHAKHHLHESPLSMTIPLMVLALLAAVGGFLGIPEALGHLVGWEHSHLLERWLAPVFVMPEAVAPHEMLPHAAEYALMVFSLAVAVVGSYAGYTLYSKRKDIPAKLATRFPALYRASLNKFYVDEIYQAVFVDNLLRLNNLLAKFDNKVVDGVVNGSAFVTKVAAFVSGAFDRIFVDGAVNLVASIAQGIGAVFRRVQSGKIQVYLYYAVGGILLVVLYRFL